MNRVGKLAHGTLRSRCPRAAPNPFLASYAEGLRATMVRQSQSTGYPGRSTRCQNYLARPFQDIACNMLRINEIPRRGRSFEEQMESDSTTLGPRFLSRQFSERNWGHTSAHKLRIPGGARATRARGRFASKVCNGSFSVFLGAGACLPLAGCTAPRVR